MMIVFSLDILISLECLVTVILCIFMMNVCPKCIVLYGLYDECRFTAIVCCNAHYYYARVTAVLPKELISVQTFYIPVNKSISNFTGSLLLVILW